MTWAEDFEHVANGIGSLAIIGWYVLIIVVLWRYGVFKALMRMLPTKYARRKRVEERHLLIRGPHYVPAAKMHGVRVLKVRRNAWLDFGRLRK